MCICLYMCMNVGIYVSICVYLFMYAYMHADLCKAVQSVLHRGSKKRNTRQHKKTR